MRFLVRHCVLCRFVYKGNRLLGFSAIAVIQLLPEDGDKKKSKKITSKSKDVSQSKKKKETKD